MMDTTQSIPNPGELRRTQLPGTFDGIRFEIGRMMKYSQECRKNPLIISMARKIVDDYREWRGRKDLLNGEETLKVIHGWGQANFVEVPNPPNIEVIETPMRLVRRLMVPAETEAMLYEPFVRKAAAFMKPQKPKITTSLASMIPLVLSLIGALGISPLRIRFGGTDGTIHYAWSSARADGQWIDVDLLEPFGKRRQFEHVEDLEVPSP